MLPKDCVKISSCRYDDNQGTNFRVDLSFYYAEPSRFLAPISEEVVSKEVEEVVSKEVVSFSKYFKYFSDSFCLSVTDKKIIELWVASPTALAFYADLLDSFIKHCRGMLLETLLPKHVLNSVLLSIKDCLLDDHVFNTLHTTAANANPKNKTSATTSRLSELSRFLPGVNESVTYPCTCWKNFQPSSDLYSVIIHLNDKCGWSREEIADWIESLDIDTTFKTPVEKPKAVEPKNSVLIELDDSQKAVVDKLVKLIGHQLNVDKLIGQQLNIKVSDNSIDKSKG